MMGILSKRKRDDGDIAASKRIKQDGTHACTTKPKTPQFQGFHLMLLQTLYDADDASPISKKEDDSLSMTTDSEMEEEIVDDKVWASVRKFVQERDNLIKLKREAGRVDDIHQEALKYMEEQGSGSTAPSTPSAKQSSASRRGWTDEDGPPSMGCRRSISSPNSLNFFSPQQATPSRSQLSPSSSSRGVHSPAKCFGLVASLLQNRSQLFNANVIRRTNPHAPLLEETERKIETLEGNLRKLQEISLSKEKQKAEDLLSCTLLSSCGGTEHDEEVEEETVTSDEMKDFASKMETKLQLWSMLASDLKDIIPKESS